MSWSEPLCAVTLSLCLSLFLSRSLSLCLSLFLSFSLSLSLSTSFRTLLRQWNCGSSTRFGCYICSTVHQSYFVVAKCPPQTLVLIPKHMAVVRKHARRKTVEIAEWSCCSVTCSHGWAWLAPALLAISADFSVAVGLARFGPKNSLWRDISASDVLSRP